MNANHITRDELADIIGISKNALRKRERRLGLDRCRVPLATRPVLFIRSRVAAVLARFDIQI